MKIYSYSEARQNLSAILNSVCDYSEEILICRKNGDKIVMMDADRYESIRETAYLLSSKSNRKALLEALNQTESGQVHPIEDLFK